MRDGSNLPDANDFEGELRDIDFRSAPAQNAPPAPVRTQLRIESSESTRSQAETMISIISPVIALRASGRFIVTTSVCPSCETSACGSPTEYLQEKQCHCPER